MRWKRSRIRKESLQYDAQQSSGEQSHGTPLKDTNILSHILLTREIAPDCKECIVDRLHTSKARRQFGMQMSYTSRCCLSSLACYQSLLAENEMCGADPPRRNTPAEAGGPVFQARTSSHETRQRGVRVRVRVGENLATAFNSRSLTSASLCLIVLL